MAIKFKVANVKGVSHNMAKGMISFSLTVDASEYKAAEELAQYVGVEGAGGDLEVTVHPRQMPLFDREGQAGENGKAE